MANNQTQYIDEIMPELVSLFKNKNEAHCGKRCTKQAEFVCPYCKKVYIKRIADVVRAGYVTCPTCGDGFSYPEKFMSNVLSQLSINFDYHVEKVWTQGYIFDFMFEHNAKKYIIETDGGIGHGKNTPDGKSGEETLNIDKIKNKIATNNGYLMIRINSDYGNENRFEYMKQAIIDNLANIFDLSIVDWLECHRKALNSKYMEVIECFQKRSKYIDEIAELTHMKSRTVDKYLHEAMNTGLLEKQTVLKTNPYKNFPANVKVIINEMKYSSRNIPVYCYEDAIIFDSITTASNYYSFNRESLMFALKRDGKHKNKHFIYYKKLPKDFDFRPKTFTSDEPQKIYQYEKDSKKLLKIYGSLSELIQEHPEYVSTNIWRACTNKRKTAYGYIWTYYKI